MFFACQEIPIIPQFVSFVPYFIHLVKKVWKLVFGWLKLLVSIANKKTKTKTNCMKKDFILLDKDGTHQRMNFQSILIIHVRGHFCRVYTRRFSFIVKSSLAQLLDQLPKGLMVQVHRNFAVNMQNATSNNPDRIFIGRHCLPWGRSFRKTNN